MPSEIPQPTQLQVFHQIGGSAFAPEPVQQPQKMPDAPLEIAEEVGPGAYGSDQMQALASLAGSVGQVAAYGIKSHKAKENQQATLEGKALRHKLQKSYAKAWADGDIDAHQNPYFLIAYEEADADLARNTFWSKFSAERERLILSGNKDILEPDGFNNLYNRLMEEFTVEYHGSSAANNAMMQSPYWLNRFHGELENKKAVASGEHLAAVGKIKVKRILETEAAQTQGILGNLGDRIREIHRISDEASRLGLSNFEKDEALAVSIEAAQLNLLNRAKRLPNIVWNSEAYRTMLDASMEAVLNGGANAKIIFDFVENSMLYGHEDIGYKNKLSEWRDENESASYWNSLKAQYGGRLERALEDGVIAMIDDFKVDARRVARSMLDMGVKEFGVWVDETYRLEHLKGVGLTGTQIESVLSTMKATHKEFRTQQTSLDFTDNFNNTNTQVRNHLVDSVESAIIGGILTDDKLIEMEANRFLSVNHPNGMIDEDGIRQDIEIVAKSIGTGQTDWIIRVGDNERVLDFEGIRNDAMRNLVESNVELLQINNPNLSDLEAYAKTFVHRGLQHPEFIRNLSEAAEGLSQGEIETARNEGWVDASGNLTPIGQRLSFIQDAVNSVRILDEFGTAMGAEDLEGISLEPLSALRAMEWYLDKDVVRDKGDLEGVLTAYTEVSARRGAYYDALVSSRSVIPNLVEQLHAYLTSEFDGTPLTRKSNEHIYYSNLELSFPGAGEDLLDHLLLHMVTTGMVMPFTDEDNQHVNRQTQVAHAFEAVAPQIDQWIKMNIQSVDEGEADGSFIYLPHFTPQQRAVAVVNKDGWLTLEETISRLHNKLDGNSDMWDQLGGDGASVEYGKTPFLVVPERNPRGGVSFRIVDPDNGLPLMRLTNAEVSAIVLPESN